MKNHRQRSQAKPLRQQKKTAPPGGGNSATQAENANNTATNNNVNDNIMGTNNDGSNINRSATARRHVLSRDMSRASRTILADQSAIEVLDYYLTHILLDEGIDDIELEFISDDMEGYLTGYSSFLCNTNIPVNHKRYLENPELVPDKFLKYSGLHEYLSKAINLLKTLCSDNEFWDDEEGLANISEAKFKRACQRSQAKKR